MNTKLIILGGNSIKNKDWVINCREYLKETFPNIDSLNYNHWNDPENSKVNISIESEKLIEKINETEDFIILAKSIGILISLTTIIENKLTPKFCLFLGFPTNLLNENKIEYLDLIKNISFKTTFIQNTEDPMGSYKKNKEIFDSISNKNIQIISNEDDSHNYNHFEIYKNYLLQEISK